MYRIEKTAKIVKISLEEVFRSQKIYFIDGIISIMDIVMSPNLANANIYLSFLSKENPTLLIKKIEENKTEIRHLLAAKVKNKMRRVPEIHFYLDTTIKSAFELDKIINNL